MKSLIKALVGILSFALVLAFAYRSSSLSRSSRSLRIELLKQYPNGHQAILINRGYLPVMVGRCDTVSDANQADAKLGDAIQRLDGEHGVWVTVYQRSDCRVVPTGTIFATFSRRWLWPGERLHTSAYFRWAGDKAIRRGDRLRFLVFTEDTRAGSPSLPSESFVAD